MDLRLAIYDLAHKYQLDAADTRKLKKLAGLDTEITQMGDGVARGVAIFAAALAGLGLIFWIAANWDSLGRVGQFTVLQTLFFAFCIGAFFNVRARIPLGLLALLSIGGLFAYFGQTYQTGADPWQLFAVWAVLALPLCLTIRSDVLWAPWALIACSGISLWIFANTGHQWRVKVVDLMVYLQGWSMAMSLTLLLSPALARFSGVGVWAFRIAVTLSSIMIFMTAMTSLFGASQQLYALGLLLLGFAAAGLALPEWFEIYGLSILCLFLNVLMISGLAVWLFSGSSDNWFGSLLLLAVLAVVLLAATVQFILKLSRMHQGESR